MKSKILIIAILFCSVLHGQNGPFYNNGVVGTIQSNGTVAWSVTEAQINVYLTDVLNNQQSISGNISSSTIVYISALGYWVLIGEGEDSSGQNLSRAIRVELQFDSNNILTVKGGGITESCTGNPCEECKFKEGSPGCDCVRGSKCDYKSTSTNS